MVSGVLAAFFVVFAEGTAVAQHRGDEPTAKPILVESRTDAPSAGSSQILERLPVNRLQELLKKNTAWRAVEAVIGATLVSCQLRHANADSPIAQVGVHAIRYSSAEWLERSRFRVEPRLVRGGFMISVKREN
jgi:hypothetical protein